MDSLLFIGLPLLVFFISLVVFAGPKRVHSFFKEDKFKGVRKGVYAVLAVAVVWVLADKAFSQEVKYFDNPEMFVGLEDTGSLSLSCYEGDYSSSLTSNLGFRFPVATYETFSGAIKYTHHSCALNKDNFDYDMWGVEVSKTFLDGDLTFFAGADKSQKFSPLCEYKTKDNEYASNFGVMYRAYTSKTKKVGVVLNYQQHTCLKSKTVRDYRAFGFQTYYKFGKVD